MLGPSRTRTNPNSLDKIVTVEVSGVGVGVKVAEGEASGVGVGTGVAVGVTVAEGVGSNVVPPSSRVLPTVRFASAMAIATQLYSRSLGTGSLSTIVNPFSVTAATAAFPASVRNALSVASLR